MFRGTTPTHIFTTDIDLSGAPVIYVTYSQNGTAVLEKTQDDLAEVTDSQITLQLSQEDTLKFAQNEPVEIQIRARTALGKAVASNIMKTTAARILKDGVI